MQGSVALQVTDKKVPLAAKQIYLGIDNLENLTEEQKGKLRKLLIKYKEVFSNKPGCHKSYI